jgi:hypothetical protein
VTVCFPNYLTWQEMQFLQRPTYFSKTCCRPLITSKFLASELHFHGWKSPEITYIGCSNGVLPKHFHKAEPRIQFMYRPMRFLVFSNHENGALWPEDSKWPTVHSTISRNGWSIVRSASFAKGGTSIKRLPQHLHKLPTWSNKVSPLTLQTASYIYCSNEFA